MKATRSIQTQARKVIEVTLASLALAGAAGTAFAQAQPVPAAKPTDATAQAAFKRADADGDNKLTPAEVARMPDIAARFTELDKDQDGSLSPTEFLLGYNGKAK